MQTISDTFACEFAAAVRQARLRLGLTQQRLALACGLSRQTIAQVESATFSDLGVRKVDRMLAVLGLSLGIAGGSEAARAAARSRRR